MELEHSVQVRNSKPHTATTHAEQNEKNINKKLIKLHKAFEQIF